MDRNRLKLELRPLCNGAYTHMTLRGSVATVAQPRDMRRLMAILWLWHGDPLDIVLYADGTNSGARWMEVWDNVLVRASAHHVNVRSLCSPSSDDIAEYDDEF
jgi:hypothetical protein